ncbi:MAG: deoxyribodipyrimidine photolyase [Deltaproteobacteria bacterium]|nr:deoxyribodipyrimidine photolyase [Deltaproteobacteria bacterium]
MPNVPSIRIRPRNNAAIRAQGDFVLYWMIAARRVQWNFALQHAAELAAGLHKPLVILEPLACSYPWASDRLHRFVLDGMACNASRIASHGKALYYPYLEPAAGAGKGMLEALSTRACAVVTDDFPAFFLPRMVDAVAPRLSVRLEQVDSNGILPMRAAPEAFTTAHSFRRFLQKNLARHLSAFPASDPLRAVSLPKPPPLPKDFTRRWPACDPDRLAGDIHALDNLPIDHDVGAVEAQGGAEAAQSRLDAFVRSGLHRYVEYHNAPDEDATSQLSPHLHFGHISAHQIFDAVARVEGWTEERLGQATDGKREGWWGMSADAESFLDQLVTWRELGFNMCWHRPDYDRYESLPAWARQTLAIHAVDPRARCYELEAFENAATHDPVWNAAQRQLRREGRIHNYLRMLWGKKILEWSTTPQKALECMLALNDKWALDGRDPNSYNGIFWVLGRYDRAWGPERRIFGKIRYMSSENTARKLAIEGYMNKYGDGTWRSRDEL